MIRRAAPGVLTVDFAVERSSSSSSTTTCNTREAQRVPIKPLSPVMSSAFSLLLKDMGQNRSPRVFK
jgi:hypothetical protein